MSGLETDDEGMGVLVTLELNEWSGFGDGCWNSEDGLLYGIRHPPTQGNLRSISTFVGTSHGHLESSHSYEKGQSHQRDGVIESRDIMDRVARH